MVLRWFPWCWGASSRWGLGNADSPAAWTQERGSAPGTNEPSRCSAGEPPGRGLGRPARGTNILEILSFGQEFGLPRLPSRCSITLQVDSAHLGTGKAENSFSRNFIFDVFPKSIKIGIMENTRTSLNIVSFSPQMRQY